ncbi:MAG TPA: AbgT family transporter [Bacillota bacterium]|nr:AbgT family transporter [Bacillota bacterium]
MQDKDEKKKFAMPDSYVILFIMLILATILTYVLPSGSFDRDDSADVPTVIPDSYSSVNSDSVGFMDFFVSIQSGMIEAADIIMLVLIIGGSFAIIDHSEAIYSGIMKLINKTREKKLILIIAVATAFSVAGFLGVMHTAVIAFIPVGVIISRALKLDAIIGVAIIYLGAYSGYTIAGLDPVTTGFAQRIAEIPVFSGLSFRFVLYLAVLISSITYIVFYVRKIEADPSKSIMGENRFNEKESAHTGVDENMVFTLRHKIVLIYFVLALSAYTIGVFTSDWGLNEMSAIFIIIGLGTAVIERIKPNDFVKLFVSGAQKMIYAALIVGLARSIVVILEDGYVLDTMVNYFAHILEPLPATFGAVSMFLFNLLFNLIITSGSGQAAIVMPILAPLADLVGFSRQIAVVAYNMGDGFTNTIAPTSGILMASIAVAGVPWTKWIRFMFPLLLIWIVIGVVAIFAAFAIGLT